MEGGIQECTFNFQKFNEKCHIFNYKGVLTIFCNNVLYLINFSQVLHQKFKYFLNEVNELPAKLELENFVRMLFQCKDPPLGVETGRIKRFSSITHEFSI